MISVVLYFCFEPTVQLMNTDDKLAWQVSFVELIENNPQIPYLHYGLYCVAIEEKHVESVVMYIEEHGWECISQTKPYFGYSLEEFYIEQQMYEDGIGKMIIGFGKQDEDDTLVVEFILPDTRHSVEQHLPIMQKEQKITTNGESHYQTARPFLYKKVYWNGPLK